MHNPEQGSTRFGVVSCRCGLHDFPSDTAAWLEEVDQSVVAAKCNVREQPPHMLNKFGIYSEKPFNKEVIEAMNTSLLGY